MWCCCRVLLATLSAALWQVLLDQHWLQPSLAGASTCQLLCSAAVPLFSRSSLLLRHAASCRLRALFVVAVRLQWWSVWLPLLWATGMWLDGWSQQSGRGCSRTGKAGCRHGSRQQVQAPGLMAEQQASSTSCPRPGLTGCASPASHSQH